MQQPKDYEELKQPMVQQDDGSKLDHEFLDPGEIQAEKRSTHRYVDEQPNLTKDEDTIVVSAPIASTIEDGQEDYDHIRSLPVAESNNNNHAGGQKTNNGPALTENTSEARDANHSYLGINVDSSLVPVSILSLTHNE